MTSSTSPPSAWALFVRGDQGVQPGRIAKLGLGHVDHERAGSVRGCFEQGRPQTVSIGDVDLCGRGYHGHAQVINEHFTDLREDHPVSYLTVLLIPIAFQFTAVAA